MTGIYEPLISVIVPVYNVELYLEDCLNSVQQQSYKNIEIILVNDGSTDLSASICDKYAEKDKRFKVIHKGNGGLPSARNAGIREFTGEYVTFIDSDDRLGLTYLEKLAAPLIRDDSIDVSLGRVVYISFSGAQKLTSVPQSPRCISKLEALRSLFNPQYGRWNMVAKLYRAELVRGITINENLTIGEDLDGTWKIFKNINKAYYADVEEYYYLWHPKSMTNTSDFREVAKHNRNFLTFINDDVAKNHPSLSNDMKFRFIADFYNEFKMNYFKESLGLKDYFYEFKADIMEASKSILCDDLRNIIQKQFARTFNDFLTYNDRMCDIFSNSKNVYIYGAGRNARVVSDYFKRRNIDFNEFIVSDGENNLKSPDSIHNVKNIQEVEDIARAYIYIAMILRNAIDVIPNLCDVPRENVFF